ncbi:MAG: hypothetical protein ACR2PF_03855 [Rhizobiaceae bacterium]
MIDLLANGLSDIPSWQAKLMICQSVEAFDLTAEQAKKFFHWAISLTDHSRPFLRAWSLHVIVIVGMKFHEFRNTSEAVLSTAASDAAASVRARARNLEKLIQSRKDIS